MKAILFSLSLCLALFACSGDDGPQTIPDSATVRSIWKTLDGSYQSVFFVMNMEKVWYTETVTFHPYAEPREIFSVLDGKIKAYGTADILDTRFQEISGVGHFYYSINQTYEGATPTISFYERAGDGSVSNREDRRNVKDWCESSFKMWSYGLTEAENAVIYIKDE